MSEDEDESNFDYSLCPYSLALNIIGMYDVNLVRVVKSVNGFREEWEKMGDIDVMKKYRMVCDLSISKTKSGAGTSKFQKIE